jgi:two-component system, LytTR family, sensor kinase
VDQQLLFVTLLLKLGVAAAVSSTLVRSKEFKNLLFRERRTPSETLWLVLFAGFPFALGVLIRGYVHNFLAADLAFEATVLMGVIAGPFGGLVSGVFISLPSLVHGQIVSLLFNAFAGVIAGLLRNLASDTEAIWTFTPFVDLSVYRWIRRNVRRPQPDWQTLFFLVLVLLGIIQTDLYFAFPKHFFALYSTRWLFILGIYASNLMCVGIALKIFNNARIERKLEEQGRAFLQARMQALQSQINPHFLFNTLNSVSSLVRFDPDTARDLIVKLANILRRLLRTTDAFVPLRDDIAFIDDYLDIEVVRFGHDKLKVVKELDPASLEVMVPSMLLQPLIENSIKHGLSPKIGGGSIYLRSRLQGSMLTIEVEDDGIGMNSNNVLEPSGLEGTGIGLANVRERLNVLYGDAARLAIRGNSGEGTIVRLTIPVLEAIEGTPAAGLSVAVPAANYELRQTQR